MKKIFINLIIVLMFSNCGYSPIYSNKNYNFDLNKITKKENNRLNSRLAKNLKNLTQLRKMKKVTPLDMT